MGAARLKTKGQVWRAGTRWAVELVGPGAHIRLTRRNGGRAGRRRLEMTRKEAEPLAWRILEACEAFELERRHRRELARAVAAVPVPVPVVPHLERKDKRRKRGKA